MLDVYGFCQRVLQAVQSTETDMDSKSDCLLKGEA
jgi:hypothetical protein